MASPIRHQRRPRKTLDGIARIHGMPKKKVKALPLEDLERIGMVTSARRAGADFRDIKRQGGWRHDGTVQGNGAGLYRGSRPV